MKTPLAALHESAGARFIEFAGWHMPVHYGSQLEEHHVVRNHAGCFDVSHMAVLDIPQEHGLRVLRRLLVGDVAKLQTGDALYSLMLNENGGIVDDLIAYKRDAGFRLVVNAGTTQKDLAWIAQCEQEVVGCPSAIQRNELCIVAVQGPNAVVRVNAILGMQATATPASFKFIEHDVYFIARTGYTGEDGVEIICPAEPACELWTKLMQIGVKPAGLGARDSLRLEAGLNLYGHDMTAATSPFESRLAWTVDWDDQDRNFIGRAALARIRAQGSTMKLVGLQLTERGIPREGCEVISNAGEGVVTSGTFSPTLRCGIALARVPRATRGTFHVKVRRQTLTAKITRLPFVQKRP